MKSEKNIQRYIKARRTEHREDMEDEKISLLKKKKTHCWK